MGLEAVLKAIKKSFTPRKMVDFESVGLHVELEPLTTIEEMKIIESIKDIDGALYIDALKRHSLASSVRKITLTENEATETLFELEGEFIDYIDDTGKKKSKSRFLYMIDFLGQWPNPMMDVLFDAYTNMQQEIEDRIKKSAKYEIVKITEKPAEDKEPVLKPILQTDEEIPKEELSETERLNRKVEKELEEADQAIAQQGQ
jgi:hypothetical protein